MANWLSAAASPWLGLTFGLLMTCFALAALWRIRVPGPVTEAERDRRRALGRRPVRLAGLSALIGPALIVWAGWQLAFPVRRPAAVLLLSRSRPEAASLLAEWRAKARHAFDQRQGKDAAFSTLDAGRLVDDACGTLKRQRSEWRRDDSGTAEAVRETLRQVLRADRVEAARGAEKLSFEALLGDGGCSGQSLPRWLVESLEVSLLRGLVESVNAVEVWVVVSERRTPMGLVWKGVAPYLKQEAHRAALHSLDVQVLSVITEPAGVRIAGVLGPLKPGPGSDEVTVRGLFSIPLNPPDGLPEKVRILLRDAKRLDQPTSFSEVGIDTTRLGRVVAFTAIFPAPPGTAGSPPQKEIAVESSEVWFPVESPQREELEKRVEIRAEPRLRERWIVTAKALTSKASSLDPAIREWQDWGRRFGLGAALFQPGECDGGGAAAGMDVVVDACPTPKLGSDTVQVYPAGEDLKDKPSRIAVDLGSFHWRGRVTRQGLPGPYSLDAMPLARDRFVMLKDSGTCVSTLAQTVAGDFASGTAGEFKSFPLIASSKVANGQLTSLGFSFRAQGMLLDARGKPAPGEPYDLGRLLSGWTQLLLAIERAPEAKSDCEVARTVEDDTVHPTSYLNAAELGFHRDTGALGSIAIFSLGLMAYGLFVLQGLRTTKNPR